MFGCVCVGGEGEGTMNVRVPAAAAADSARHRGVHEERSAVAAQGFDALPERSPLRRRRDDLGGAGVDGGSNRSAAAKRRRLRQQRSRAPVGDHQVGKQACASREAGAH